MSKKKVTPKQVRNSKKKQDLDNIMTAIQAVQMVSLMVLRDRGYGAKRLKDFNDEFNNLVDSVSRRYITLSDIIKCLEDETGLKRSDLVLKTHRPEVGK